jgi:hypothetical protein
VFIWYKFFPVFVSWTNKNLATLEPNAQQFLDMKTEHGVIHAGLLQRRRQRLCFRAKKKTCANIEILVGFLNVETEAQKAF